ncbi:hypothetical protein HYH03_018033 [Edaphochlamys debaryana]|uniref:Uncharacterized protein n=1 Tax=Edaphochlamys debaryana TaxID=47281 RepID=A0A835XL86_9CHLO|nr:hypothetical protein HYH03_018033 [Edaphochlamys debaryana]|eukprot:KAG2483095.1 hypothetical protein HYH03_018033 [Edaphochlamys debaryana]
MGAGHGQMVPAVLGPMVSGMGPAPALYRLAPDVVNSLAAMAGPPGRMPLVYTGDTSSSLSALRDDLLRTYTGLCSALGEAPRSDLMAGNLPAAAALGLPMPPTGALTGGFGFGLGRMLPPLPGGQLALPAPPLPSQLLTSSAAAPISRLDDLALGSATGLGGGATGMMGLGGGLGIEGVGSGADAPSRMLSAGPGLGGGGGGGGYLGGLRSLSAGTANPYALETMPGLAHRGGAGRSFGSGLPPIPGVGGGAAATQAWPMGRPGGAAYGGAAYGGAYGGAGPQAAYGRTGALGAGGLDGPRVGMVTGLTRPQDPNGDMLGEESALVYPPAGRDFSGAPSAAARGAMWAPGGYGARGQAIDPMDDLKFRAGPKKSVLIEDVTPGGGRIGALPGEGGNLESYLQDFARDRSKPNPLATRGLPPVGGGAAPDRYRMPF